MQLWNDYEGTTIAGQWKLGALLRTEGRSALFATTRADGRPAVLRLTEALNDQAVLQARYRAIQAAGDRYLVAVEGFGDAELDGAPLSYAVLEATQESLAEIVAVRRLAPEEAQEVAVSVAGGLLALHGQGLVHGHVEPENVLAAGDRIKLRADCARPAPSAEDAALEGAVTPQTDALGLAGLIYRSLTQGRLHDASDALALPEPFAAIVRNTARGTWGVAEIEAELERYSRAHAVPVVAPVKTPAAASGGAPAASPAGIPGAAVAAGKQAASLESTAATGQLLSSRAASADALKATGAESAWQQPERVSSGNRRNILIGIGVVVVLLILFLAFHHGASRTTGEAGPPASGAVAAPPAASPESPAAATAPETAPEAQASTSQTAAASSGSAASGTKVWRVIAYTYNRREEAAAKAASINQHSPGFDAQVWSHSGQRPFLVELGDGMEKPAAFALRARARKAGIARDVYAQNYSR